MKKFKKFLKIGIGLIFVFFMFLLWYQNKYSMDVAESYDINASVLQKKLLIATQGSEFKNIVTGGIVDYFKQDSVYVKVIDVSSLTTVDPKDFNALVVIHTWENWKPPAEVKTFMDRTKNYRDKIVVVTTSGKGSFKMEEVDAIAGESVLDDAPEIVKKMIFKLTAILD